jgi:putative CocE/NonD family hydrolase
MLMSSMKTPFVVMLAFVAGAATPSLVTAQDFAFGPAEIVDTVSLSRAMPRLARQVRERYHSAKVIDSLDNTFRLQMVEGDYASAVRSVAALRERRLRSDSTPRARGENVQYEIYAKAMARGSNEDFPVAFRDVFRETLGRMDDRTAGFVMRLFALRTSDVRGPLAALLRNRGNATSISLEDALALLRAYQVVQSYVALEGVVQPLVTEDDQRRYDIRMNVQVPTPDGAIVCAMIVRPRSGPSRLPTLLQFTIYADSAPTYREARLGASNQYASVIGYTRGKACSPQAPLPYERDGADAAALIDWISSQSWSDGRVGMYGGSYSGFTPWAAAKHMPKGLAAIMVGAPVTPGIDVPMEGNVFWNFVYPWPFYTTNTKGLDDATYNDFARWNRLYREWYVSGRAYHDLPKIDGTPNPVFDAWIAHPTHDAYWRAMIPAGQEYARINIPVLQTAGYYFGGPGAAVSYLTEHVAHNEHAQHYLVIGPYDHFQAQRGVIGVLGDTETVSGYQVDPAARIDLRDLRYQWFDHVLKNRPRPALLANKVNYEIVNGNVWRHAPSIAAMATGSLRFYLSAEPGAKAYRLDRKAPSKEASLTLTVDLADRSDADRFVPGGGVVDTVVDTLNSLEFVSDPIPAPMELAGLFTGKLDFITNKRDFDFGISVYELTPKGEYIQLPPYWSRASHVESASTRRLLTPEARQRLSFTSRRLMGHRLGAGSRVVVLLGVLRSTGQEINYGTGKIVSEETIADAGPPLTIRWFTDSSIDLPVRR